MAKAKRAIALFEIIHRQPQALARSESLAVPDWWRGTDRSPSTPQLASRPPQSASPQATPTPDSTPAVAASPQPAGRIVWFDRGRLHLSLNVTSCGVVLGLALLLVAASFTIGKRAGWADARQTVAQPDQDSLAAARAAPANPSVLQGLLTGRASRRPARAKTIDRPTPARKPARLEPGKTYLVVQTFRRSAYHDAVQASQFLASKGVPNTIVPVETGYKLIALEAFDYGNPAERERLKAFRQSVRRLGRIYASPKYRGAYSFADCYPQTFKGN